MILEDENNSFFFFLHVFVGELLILFLYIR